MVKRVKKGSSCLIPASEEFPFPPANWASVLRLQNTRRGDCLSASQGTFSACGGVTATVLGR